MNLNIFKRIADLEETISHLYKLHDITITTVNSLSDELSQLRQAKQTDAEKIMKRRAYARAYYLKKKTERNGRKQINFVKVSK